jgi:hypothetical protein
MNIKAIKYGRIKRQYIEPVKTEQPMPFSYVSPKEAEANKVWDHRHK